VAEEFHAARRIWRAIDDHRARALHHLDALAANALGGLFRARDSKPSDFRYELARMIARDLTARGMVVHDSANSVSAGGVWLAPAPTTPRCSWPGRNTKRAQPCSAHGCIGTCRKR
jgi:hypothetical protein